MTTLCYRRLSNSFRPRTWRQIRRPLHSRPTTFPSQSRQRDYKTPNLLPPRSLSACASSRQLGLSTRCIGIRIGWRQPLQPSRSHPLDPRARTSRAAIRLSPRPRIGLTHRIFIAPIPDRRIRPVAANAPVLRVGRAIYASRKSMRFREGPGLAKCSWGRLSPLNPLCPLHGLPRVSWGHIA